MAELQSKILQKGDILFRDGDIADCAYVVEHGEVVILANVSGIERVIGSVNAGELLGEMAMLDAEPRSATAVAKTDVRLTVIERDQLVSRLASADPVLHLVLTVLLNRLRQQLHPEHSQKPALVSSDAGLIRIKLENELRAGLGAGEMRLFLQPIADILSQKIAGFEALVRWEHPEKGLVRPDLFIKLAEDSGLMIPLGRWIVHEACRIAQLMEQQANSAGVQGQGAFISINVSTMQFKDTEFFAHLQSALSETAINPKRVKLEITESSLTDAEAAKRWIKQCKSYGVRVALDDFGTGYSSLSYLHEFEIDTLKIDQSFVRKMMTDEKSRHIVEAIIALSTKLSLEIIAEGIETQEHIDALKALGCQYIQGYIIAKPAPLQHYL